MLEVYDVLGKLGVEPIVLSKKPTAGKTLIEKFEANVELSAALVLLVTRRRDRRNCCAGPDQAGPAECWRNELAHELSAARVMIDPEGLIR
jgi:hypothetical protein